MVRVRAAWRCAVVALVGVGALGALGCGPGDEIVVAVRTDLPPARLGAIGVFGERLDGGALFARCTCVDGADCVAPPHTLGLVPGARTDRRFRVQARGFAAAGCDGDAFVEQSATVRFQSGRRLLELGLYDACVGVTCAAGSTCDPASRSCVSDERGELPALDGADLAAPAPDLAPDAAPDLARPILAPFKLAGPSTFGAPAASEPAVACDGTRYLVLWTSVAPVASNTQTQLLGALVDPATRNVTPLDALDTAVSGIDANYPVRAPAAAGAPTGPFAVAWVTGPSDFTGRVPVGSVDGATGQLTRLREVQTTSAPRTQTLDLVTDGAQIWGLFYADPTVLQSLYLHGTTFSSTPVDTAISAPAFVQLAGPGPMGLWLHGSSLWTSSWDGSLFPMATAAPLSEAPARFGLAAGTSAPVVLYPVGTDLRSATVSSTTARFKVRSGVPLTDDAPALVSAPGPTPTLVGYWTEQGSPSRLLYTATFDGDARVTQAPAAIDTTPSPDVYGPRAAARRLPGGGVETLVVWLDGQGGLWAQLR